MSNRGYEYSAFISYSHQDRSVAVRLHRALESYRIPRRLRELRVADGLLDHLLPMFRDREELSASGDLTSAVNEALRRSEFLIVLCSPAAAASRWVNAEIREFKRQHGEDRVLPVIVSGVPHASNPEQECFPEALKYRFDAEGASTDELVEPLAADLGVDGRRRTRLKLIAAMLEVKLDELIQREQQRHNRRLAGATALSLTGVMITTVLAVTAYTARNEAVFQRSQAESLIEFMLTDLRRKLDTVGRLDVLDDVGERARAYYASLPPESLNDEALSRNSRALHLIGEIKNLSGDLVAARAVFENAYATTEEMLSRAPDDSQRLFDHAQSAFWLGYLDWQRGNSEEATTAFLIYERLAERLVNNDPGNAEWLAELGHAGRNLGVLLLEQHSDDAAEQAFRKSLANFKQIAAEETGNADWQQEVGQGHAWLADALLQQQRFEGALRERLEERDVYRLVLSKEPDNNQVRDKLVVTYRNLGEITLALGKKDDARNHLLQAVENSRRLLRWDADNTLWMEFACSSLLDLAALELLSVTGAEKSLLAAALIEEAMVIAEELNTRDADVLAWRIDMLARARIYRAVTMDVEPAEAMLDSVIADLEIELRVDQIHSPRWLAEAYRYRAKLNDATAEADWQRVIDLLSSQNSTAEQVLLMEALIRTKSADQAVTIGGNLKRSGYLHPEFIGLIDEIADVLPKG